MWITLHWHLYFFNAKQFYSTSSQSLCMCKVHYNIACTQTRVPYWLALFAAIRLFCSSHWHSFYEGWIVKKSSENSPDENYKLMKLVKTRNEIGLSHLQSGRHDDIWNINVTTFASSQIPSKRLTDLRTQANNSAFVLKMIALRSGTKFIIDCVAFLADLQTRQAMKSVVMCSFRGKMLT